VLALATVATFYAARATDFLAFEAACSFVLVTSATASRSEWEPDRKDGNQSNIACASRARNDRSGRMSPEYLRGMAMARMSTMSTKRKSNPHKKAKKSPPKKQKGALRPAKEIPAPRRAAEVTCWDSNSWTNSATKGYPSMRGCAHLEAMARSRCTWRGRGRRLRVTVCDCK